MYFIKKQYEVQCKNQLQKNVLYGIKTFYDGMMFDDMDSFKKDFRDFLDKANAAHNRCKPVVPEYRKDGDGEILGLPFCNMHIYKVRIIKYYEND